MPAWTWEFSSWLWRWPRLGHVFFLFLRVGLRARTSFVNGVYLGRYSEFALFLVALLASRFVPSLLPTIVLAVAVTMALSSTAARFVHPFFRRWEARLVPFERRGPHPDAEPVKVQGATVLVVGMGRTGGAVYRTRKTQGETPLVLDADPSKKHKHKGDGFCAATLRHPFREAGEKWRNLEKLQRANQEF
ncbi:MAG: hypothetical protein ACUVRY_07160 [Thermoanaerobaculaceae bacterium]